MNDDAIYNLAQARGSLLAALEVVDEPAYTHGVAALTALNTTIAALSGIPCRRCGEHILMDLIGYSGDHALVYCDACDLHGVYWLDGRGYSIGEVRK